MELMNGNFRHSLILIGALFLTRCTNAQENGTITLEGSWKGCNGFGDYVEVHFSKYESLLATSDIIDLTYSIPYTVRNNEIHYTNIQLQKNSIDEFILKEDSLFIKHENQTYSLHRMSDYPIVPLKSRQLGEVSFTDSVLYVHYQRMFLLREVDHECNSK